MSGQLHTDAIGVARGLTPDSERCWCHSCRPVTLADMRMVLCPNCGNKRCPRANDHRNACTFSNEPGQPGSAYPARWPSCAPLGESDDPEGGACE